MSMIYYMLATISYRKGKSTYTRRDQWLVSIYTTPEDIMWEDRSMMSMLEQRYYGSSYKGKRTIQILEITSKRKLSKSMVK